jgi:histidyl-tRNA synthetase
MAVKPSIPKGTRDFSPTEVAQRTYIFNTIKKAFELFGFMPIETPAFENSSTLMGKYGEEGDRLIFKILNSGDFLRSFNENLIKSIKEALYNLQIALLNNSEVDFNFEDFKINFLKEFPNLLRSNKKIKFDESYINLQRLTEDIWLRVSEIILKKEKLYNKLLKNDISSLSELSNIIFSDFYFQLGNKYVGNYISEKALRYDLTVPFARYVVQHQNDITFPFKRYQMQPVWRADRPQKGRFREFYQCDADVVGSKSLWQEVAFVQLYDDVFTRLKLPAVKIKLNNRKILSGLAEIIGAKDKLIDFTVALDKLDKIGVEGVTKEMLLKGISQEAIDKVQPLFKFKGTNNEKLAQLRELLSVSEEGMKGVEELSFVVETIDAVGLQSAVLEIDVTLARGLNYYTGAIYEVEAAGVNVGSIGGGGRYDDLTGIFGLKNVSGIGISFGLDRIYLALEALNLFEEVALPKPKVLFINFGDTEALYAVKAIKQIRLKGMNAELYPEASKMKKQMAYANKRGIEFVVLTGSKEIENQEYTLKNMQSGTQQNCSLKELIEFLKNS